MDVSPALQLDDSRGRSPHPGPRLECLNLCRVIWRSILAEEIVEPELRLVAFVRGGQVDPAHGVVKILPGEDGICLTGDQPPDDASDLPAGKHW